jgi:DNA-binding response OmpR family regulator
MNAQDDCGQGRRVLIVEDSVDSAQMMRVLFKLMGYAAQTAYDGREALKIAGTFLPEIVLLDLTLPDMTGQEVAAQIRKNGMTAGALIIAVSGFDEPGAPPGVDHILVKPLDHDALRAILAAGVSKRGATGPSLNVRAAPARRSGGCRNQRENDLGPWQRPGI